MDMIEFAIAKLFHIPSIDEFKKGGQLCPLLTTLLASLLQYIPQIEKDIKAAIISWFVKFGRHCEMLRFLHFVLEKFQN